ncbi:hypothetical protein Tco_1144972 [Tanacetum coccineum]
MESIRRNFFNGVQCHERKIVWIEESDDEHDSDDDVNEGDLNAVDSDVDEVLETCANVFNSVFVNAGLGGDSFRVVVLLRGGSHKSATMA